MMKYAILSANGLPLLLGEAETMPEGGVALHPSTNLIALRHQYCVDGTWIDRPAIGLTLTQDDAGAHLTLTAAPAATRIVIHDIDAAELLFSTEVAPGEAWHLPDPGRYAIEADGPAPWLPATLSFEVPA
jgi:hypothetical protein